MKLLHSILKAILYKPVKRVRLFDVLEGLGCEIKSKKPTCTCSVPDGSIMDFGTGGCPDYNLREAPKNRIDEAIKALGNYNISRVSEVNNIDEANGYINRKKDIEGITPVKLWTKQRGWKEKNTPHVKN